MQLLLLRHADAEPLAASDAERSLTEKGLRQAHRAGRFCRERGIRPELILSSPFNRATQTAGIVGRALGVEVTECPFLACGMAPATAFAELRGFGRFGTLLIVGHEPDFGLLAATLLGLPTAEALKVRKATLLGLRIAHFRPGGATLELLIPSQWMDAAQNLASDD